MFQGEMQCWYLYSLKFELSNLLLCYLISLPAENQTLSHFTPQYRQLCYPVSSVLEIERPCSKNSMTINLGKCNMMKISGIDTLNTESLCINI